MRLRYSTGTGKKNTSRQILACMFRIVAVLIILTSVARGDEYYVSPSGSDTNPGSLEAPFQTIRKAARIINPGDVCYLREGHYRETVDQVPGGTAGARVRFEAYNNERVVIDGTEPLTGQWSVYKDNIYKLSTFQEFEQLFVDDQMMLEARWPNIRFDQILDRDGWAAADEGSRYGQIADPDLAQTGVDWTGAIAVMNLAHQFFTWTRVVRSHSAGQASFTYDTNLDGITHYADKTGPWEDDKYYLFGKLEALDAANEWFLDTISNTVYLYLENGENPTDHTVVYKKRDYGFNLQNVDYVELKNLIFFGTTFQFNDCNNCVVEGCRLYYPSYTRRITDYDPQSFRKNSVRSLVRGENNRIQNSSFAYANGEGLKVIGSHNFVENCVIHDVNWFGTLLYVGLSVAQGDQTIIRSNTVYNVGNSIISCGGDGAFTVEYNHVYNGGLVSKDVSLVYTASPRIYGSNIRYNWIHGIHSLEDPGGRGIRGDDQTRGLRVYNNVVWDCGERGIVVKGDENKIYNNTILDVGEDGFVGYYINLPNTPEPEKWWRPFQWPLLEEQNANSTVYNNATRNIIAQTHARIPYPESDRVTHNYMQDPKLMDPEHFDFRPQPDSPLIDAGRVIPYYTLSYQGEAPDIGAYEYGGDFWQAGADWSDPGYSPGVTAVQSGYGGDPLSIPGTLQAEYYDNGGESTAYHDSEPENLGCSQGECIRSGEGVDVTSCADSGDGFCITNIKDNEWLEYSLQITPGTYNIGLRIYPIDPQGRVQVILGSDTLGVIDLSDLTTMETWQTIGLDRIRLSGADHAYLRLEFTGSAGSSVCLLNWISFQDVQSPFETEPYAFPGKIQAENYDLGGQNVAFFDTDPDSNLGQAYRFDGVDISGTTDESGDYDISHIQNQEWLEYTVDIEEGTFDLFFRIYQEHPRRQIRILMDRDTLAVVDLPRSKNWQTVKVAALTPPVGKRVMRLEFISSEESFDGLLNWIEMAPAFYSGDLLGYWNFDESQGQVVNDVSEADSVEDDGVLGSTGYEESSDPIWMVSRPDFGSCLSFNGNTQVTIPHSQELNPTDALTLTCWMRLARPVSEFQNEYNLALITKQDWASSTGYHFVLVRPTQIINFRLLSGNQHMCQLDISSLEKDKWYFVGGKFDGKWMEVFLYENGSLKLHAQSEYDGTIEPSTLDLKIGSNFEGDIDDVRIYDYPLNIIEIQQLAGGALETSVQDPETAKIPDRFYLADNYPNPFNPQTTIRYQLPVTTPIKIEIYNILGKRVRTLIDRVQQSGEHYIRWDTKDDFGHPVASGVYIYRMQVESTERFVDFKKMLLLR